jgi:pSer/pThr/pTyr-binding forkhead associated (FHA) protein
MRVVLSIFVGKKERGSFSIVGDVTVIGRARPCDVRLGVSQVSRRHCQLVREGDELRVEDLGSSNGTFHNGEKVERAVLAAGDKIGIGAVTVLVRINDLPREEESDDTAGAATEFVVDEGEIEGEEEDSLVDFEADEGRKRSQK